MEVMEQERTSSRWGWRFNGILVALTATTQAVPLDRLSSSHQNIVLALHGLIDHVEFVSVEFRHACSLELVRPNPPKIRFGQPNLCVAGYYAGSA